MRAHPSVFRFVLSFAAVLALLPSLALCQEEMTRLEREQRQAMLSTAYDDIRKQYYDPKFHGLDWKARYQDAKENVAKAKTKTEANLQIAAMLEGLNDSHTHFIPPRRAVREDYGFFYQMIGDRCFVTHVQPGSDAEAKGLKRGDEVLTINGFTPTRDSLPKMQYVLNVLYPQVGLRLDVRDPAGNIRKADVMAKEKETPLVLTGVDRWRDGLVSRENRRQEQPTWVEFGEKLMILRLSNFLMTDLGADGLAEKARQHTALIIDLRGNPGGALNSLRRFLGDMFEKDVKIGEEVKRDKTTPQITKGRGADAFKGKLLVLVDSSSASASEIFSRAVQIEKRGTVLGDVTSGSVMAAEFYPHTYGTHEVLFYAVEVSVADFVMSDGKTLEHVGVTPDEKFLPSQQDLAAGRDPLLAHAAHEAGINLSPEKAAELFPFDFPKE
jgi:carboxyl-terminal processing protease